VVLAAGRDFGNIDGSRRLWLACARRRPSASAYQNETVLAAQTVSTVDGKTGQGSAWKHAHHLASPSPGGGRP